MKHLRLVCLSMMFLLIPSMHQSARASNKPVGTSSGTYKPAPNKQQTQVASSKDETLERRRLERARRRARQRLKRRFLRSQTSRRPRRRAERSAPTRTVHVTGAQTSELPDFTGSLAVGLRVTAAEPAGTNLGLSTANQPILAGAGLQLRGRLTPRLGTEVTLDVLEGEVGTMVQTTVPLMAAAVYYPLPQSRIQPYGLLGAGVHLSTLSSGGSAFQRDVTELAGQVGAGLEVFLSRHLSLHADLRGHGVVVDSTVRGRMASECALETGSTGGMCAQLSDGAHKITLGGQVTLGTSVYF